MNKRSFKQLIKSIHRLTTTKIHSFSSWIHSLWRLRIAQFRSPVRCLKANQTTIFVIASIRLQIQGRFSIQRQEVTHSILATSRIFPQAITPSRYWDRLVSLAQPALVKPRHSSRWQLSTLVMQVLLSSSRVPSTLPHTCLALLNWLNSLIWTTIWLDSRRLFIAKQLGMEELFLNIECFKVLQIQPKMPATPKLMMHPKTLALHSIIPKTQVHLSIIPKTQVHKSTFMTMIRLAWAVANWSLSFSMMTICKLT